MISFLCGLVPLAMEFATNRPLHRADNSYPTPSGGVPFVSATLLNENQRRRLASALSVLTTDLETLSLLPQLGGSGAEAARVRATLAEAFEAMARLRTALSIPVDPPPSAKRRLRAVAGVWSDRIHELRPRRLRGYGPVHAGLGDILEPHLDQLQRVLTALSQAARALPGD